MRPSETEEVIELSHWGMELLKRDARCKLEDVEIDLIWDFGGHPFPVREGRDMDELVESIRKMGQLEPALIRKLPDGSYEMLVRASAEDGAVASRTGYDPCHRSARNERPTGGGDHAGVQYPAR